MNNSNNNDNNDVHITHINPRTEFNDLEKTAIIQFEFEKKQEELSKTKKFQLLNSKKKNSDDSLLPKLKEKLSNTMEIILPIKKNKENSLSNTIKLKISDLRAKLDEEEFDLPKKKRSLYDTVIIKLDDLINKKNAIKRIESKKVTSIEDTNYKKVRVSKSERDLKKLKTIKLNVNSPEYGKQLYNLNKIALNNLSLIKHVKVRKYSSIHKLEKVDKVHVSKEHFESYQKKLNKFAINKLYYKFAPKETKKYKLYRFSVFASSIVLMLASIAIVNWFVQGAQINSLSHSLKEEAQVTSSNEGQVVGVPQPSDDGNKNIEDPETDLYWRYLNTPLSSVDFNSLLEQNSDTVGWLIVNNTNINYPVVQTDNNDYYLNHSFDNSVNNAGWVFADFRDSFSELGRNTVIYGHGRKDKVMFGSLNNTLEKDWYTNVNNQIIQLSTPNYNTMWQVFSVYKIRAESYYITTGFSSEESYSTFLKTIKERSIYDFGISVNNTDKVLTLSTCYNDNGVRLVLHAKLVKIQNR